jgi:hypothetical protein
MHKLRCALLIGTCVLIGCMRSPHLVQVQGTVLVDGEPVPGVQLIFHPQGDGGGVPASGITNEKGQFSLMSGLESGIRPGHYRVTATWPDPSVEPTEQQKMLGHVEPGPDLLNEKFSTPRDSQLTVEIEPGMKELPPLELSTSES